MNKNLIVTGLIVLTDHLTIWQLDNLSVFITLPHPLNCCGTSHEIKRRLLLGRKIMTNLDSIFKSRDIILPTNVYLVFLVVMYECESWTIKKGEHQRMMLLNCGVGEVS